MARVLDRLEPGNYSVELRKSGLPDGAWDLVIVRMGRACNQVVRTMRIEVPSS